jgi:hypothetical protein
LTGTRIPVKMSSMTPKGHPRKASENTIKTTVDLPHDLWRAAKVRAMDERTDLRSVIIKALEAHLNTKPRGREAS